MVEMRWVPLNKSNSQTPHAVRNLADDYLVLQYRYRRIRNGDWSEWIDVPTVTEP